MECFTGTDQVPSGYGPSVVTVGNFDGVHRGHRSVLVATVAEAARRGVRAVAVTFHPHPAQVHRPEQAPELLTGLADRLELLADTGLDATLVIPYTLEFARTTPREFVHRYLVDTLHAVVVCVGRDVRFGRANSGDLGTMMALGDELGFQVQVIEDTHGPQRGAAPRRWSSTWARELLAAGDIAAARQILGRAHRIRGVVVHGDARGRALGYPTANLGPDMQGMVPADGVYAGWLVRPGLPDGHPDRRLTAAVSIGTNPTFDGVERRVEAYALDRDDLDLYGEEVVVELVDRLRATLRFASVEELRAQMRADVDAVRSRVGGGR